MEFRITPYKGLPGALGSAGLDDVAEDPIEPIAFARVMEQPLDQFHQRFRRIRGQKPRDAHADRRLSQGSFPSLQLDASNQAERLHTHHRIGIQPAHRGDKALHIPDMSEADFLYWAEKNVRAGHTDFVGVGRQSIADPEFARKILEGRASKVRWRINC
jgi:hypothetical protein